MKEQIHKILSEAYDMDKTYNRRDYLKWKRENVTYRGMKEIGEYNNGSALWGNGLYTAALSNRKMAREYGEVYFLVYARPKHPKVVQSVNTAEIFFYELIKDYCEKHGKEYDPNWFFSKTTIEDEMLLLGYDGFEIRGREMVNYTPDNDKIIYFKKEYQLENYYQNLWELGEV